MLTIRRARPEDLDALQFFLDTTLRRDYFMRRGQLHELLTARRHRVYVATLDHVLVAIAITTRPHTLVNLLVHPAYRGLRIGSVLLARVAPRLVRIKTDMTTGDPTPFYAKLAYRPLRRPTARSIALATKRTPRVRKRHCGRS